jgi:hypothetical protein
LSFSQEITKTEVKRWITKNSVPNRETHKRTDASSTIPPDGLKVFSCFESAF